MATWKEKGVVPDSEDEDDSDLESQNNDTRTNISRLTENHGENGHKKDEEIGEDPPAGVKGLSENVEEEVGLPDLCETPHEASPVAESQMEGVEEHRALPELLPRNTSSMVEHLKSTIGEVQEMQSSPVSPQRVFKVPQLPEPGEISYSSSPLDPSNSQLSNASITIPIEEDISRSYVRITSASNSPLSSPPSSRDLSGPTDSLPVPSAIQPQSFRAPIEDQDSRSTSNNYTRTRSLRHRNAIQLHPYMLEQEKYRQTLKARGMVPMRLAHTPDDQGHAMEDSWSSPNPEPESQSTEVATGDGQAMDFDWEMPSSPPDQAAKNSESTAVRNDGFDDSDDDLPDLHELLHMPRPAISRPEAKRRMKQYLSKHKRPQLVSINAESSRLNRTTYVDNDTGNFDVPVSPPFTSPSHTTTSRSARELLPPNLHFPSTENTPLRPEERRFRARNNLPTPVTSAVKPASEAILVKSDVEMDSSDPSPLVDSSSDESVQLRKVGRKIRGVLPASHLRLDQAKMAPRALSPIRRRSFDEGPLRTQVRRGVAIPKPSKPADRTILDHFGLPLLSDDSEEEEETYPAGIIAEDDTPGPLEELFNRQRLGFADEDDRIDAMLPTHQRQPRINGNQPRKRGRVELGAGSAFSRNTRWPKITDQPDKFQTRQSNSKTRKRRHDGAGSGGPSHAKRARKPPPRLGILDVVDSDHASSIRQPHFVRIATRTAKCRKGLGRQSPTRKYIRLANREDTLDATSVLQDWKMGRIQPRVLENQRVSVVSLQSSANDQIQGMQQRRAGFPLRTAQSNSASIGPGPRRLHISKPPQRSMDDFVTITESIGQQENSLPIQHQQAKQARLQPRRAAYKNATPGRPAQLESTIGEHLRWDSSLVLESTKRSLDSVFKALRRRREPHTNLQLNRFLLDTAAHQSTTDPHVASVVGDQSSRASPRIFDSVSRRKTTAPLRMDVCAARYRQPSEPLVLENFSVFKTIATEESGNKLQGLGKFGTRYPTHFDILPLNSFVYFHESTFIGSGRLGKALKGIPQPHHDDTQFAFTLGNQTFSWGQWNATVSSEMGVCVDWIVDQLTSSQQPPQSQPTTSAMDIVDLISGFVQSHLVFPESHDELHFLSRMSELFRDFLARLGEVSHKAHQSWIEVLATCTVVVYWLLLQSQKFVDGHLLILEFEALLKTLTSKVVRLLLSDGLDKLRMLYDDLQYFSIRESGLKNDQPAIHAWVVVMKVLNAARIPRGSFWDVTTPILCEVNIEQTKDARVLEKLWYSMFTLLPLCEFDEFGIISPSSRHRASFDNWPIPQKILKRIFELYTSNPRQPPGFNDYCKANLSRCHYLTTEWGWWKCTGIIGSVFDFFASQKLAHLRNEEVYDSPRFLRALDEEPSLSLEPEDRCFHILLKLAALAIIHMGKEEDGKGVRNLIIRLLPNHNRQFPKEEAIHHRELASLRNHHDLLSTLYFSAPPDQRPSPNLIQDLVIADRSHNEACLINLRAWENLTKFVVTSSSDVNFYRPFTSWQNTLSSALSKQYIEIELEMRNQADSLAKDGLDTVSETFLRQTINTNKRSTIEMLRAMIKTMDHTVMSSKHAQMTILALNPRVLTTLCSQEILGDMAFTEGLLGDCLNVLNHYMKQIDQLKPVTPPQGRISYATDGESQGSEDMNLSLDRIEMIYRLQSEIIPLIRGILLKGLQRLHDIRPLLLHDTVRCWARLVAKMSEGALNVKDFLINGPNAVFQQRPRLKQGGIYWPVFLSELVEQMNLSDLKIPGFDIGTEWLVIIASPPLIETFWLDAVDTLTVRLRSAGHFLLKGHSCITSNSSTLITTGKQRLPSYILFRSAVDAMRMTLLSQANINSVFDNSSPKEAQFCFSTMLKQVMESMKDYLESMTPNTEEHLEYVKVVQPIISIIRSYASDIQPLLEFFVMQSIYYWPEDTDPTMYAAGIVSYSLRLSNNQHRTSPELFHYLYNGWRKDLVEDQTNRHMSFVRKGMSRWEFTLFLLSEFTPAALQVGFEIDGGWVLCATYLPVLSTRLIKLLERQDKNADAAFDLSINLLKIIANGLVGVLQSLTNNTRVDQLCIIQVTIRFWFSLILPLRHYPSPDLAKSQLNESVQASILRFILSACRMEEDDFGIVDIDSETYQSNNGQYFHNFKSVLRDDIVKNWEVQDDGFEITVGGMRPRDVTKTHLNLRRVVGEALTSVQMLELVVPLVKEEGVKELMEEFPALMLGGRAWRLYF